MNFREFVNSRTIGTEEVDESQIDAVYNKAHLAVELVRLYDQVQPIKHLKNISTIANLHQSGVYGLYNSSENKKFISDIAKKKLEMKFGQQVLQKNPLDRVPRIVIAKYLGPEIASQLPTPRPNQPDSIQPMDVIHINVASILATKGQGLNAIITIAKTIIHECTHEIELDQTGKTSEIGPEAAEAKFENWVKTNWNMITQKIPMLKTIPN